MERSGSSAHGLHEQLIQALRNDDQPTSMDISLIRLGIDRVRQDIDIYHATSTEAQMRTSIEYQIECLQYEVDILLESREHHIRTLRRSLQLFLLLLWPSKALQDLNILAEDLRQALIEPHIRLCSSMALPIWQLSIGAVAAGTPGETRSWFIGRLQELCVTMNVKVMDKGVASLTETFMPDARLLGKFQLVWQEVSRSSQCGSAELSPLCHSDQ